VSGPCGQSKGEVAHGTKTLKQKLLGPGPNEESILEKGLDGKAPAVK
jgi:hypothetical protein